MEVVRRRERRTNVMRGKPGEVRYPPPKVIEGSLPWN